MSRITKDLAPAVAPVRASRPGMPGVRCWLLALAIVAGPFFLLLCAPNVRRFLLQFFKAINRFF